MTKKEISQLIEKEINGDWSISNWHNCDLKKCLIRPKRRKLELYYPEEIKVKDFWIVLEEKPETLDGFKVFLDEESKNFELAMHSDQFGYVCNFHDTFLAAFKSM